jgi:cytochrome c oxidase assembly protein subunit 15
VGLAVPDWPSTFGQNMFLYEFGNDAFGVRIEHLHRLYGAAVGLATIVLAGWLWMFDPRRWIKALGILALAAVVIQGVLGGLRVTQLSTFLAAVHGSTGQAFFGLMVALCVLTGPSWKGSQVRAGDPDHLRRRSAVVLVLVYAQIVLGSWLRHYGTGAALWSHGIFGAAVWAHVGFLVYRIERRRAELGGLVLPSRVLGLTASLQVVLGLASLAVWLPLDAPPRLVTTYQAIVRTGHQTTAALIFAASIVLTLRAFQQFASGAAAAALAVQPKERPLGRPEPAALDWEAVA